ncbi:MAG: plastocyanin/azurin family copper-binding protein [Candidatus Colwellbacteria bacterium]|nr:plastocyanin/azurin family copper-binding protein [Candidatus Colwellbacteria bacterium]
MDKNKLIIVLTAVAVIVVTGIVIFSMKDKSAPVPADNNPVAIPEQVPAVPVSEENAVSMTDVLISGFSFQPGKISIKKGSTVKWTNENDIGHDVVADIIPPYFKSPILLKGESYSFTFDKVGTFGYYCGIHPSMKGTIEVVE